ncbi:hypothetical protein P692DRAFT_20880088 [Suillus brevipes Sb2]|nr:hypothetical protein P692DRAFT_20880088 [Suillus brevipes Sb2]
MSFCSNIASPKDFLFDKSCKIHVAADTSSVDQPTLNLCCDYLYSSDPCTGTHAQSGSHT